MFIIRSQFAYCFKCIYKEQTLLTVFLQIQSRWFENSKEAWLSFVDSQLYSPTILSYFSFRLLRYFPNDRRQIHIQLSSKIRDLLHSHDSKALLEYLSSVFQLQLSRHSGMDPPRNVFRKGAEKFWWGRNWPSTEVFRALKESFLTG